jgi:cell division protein FtsQ
MKGFRRGGKGRSGKDKKGPVGNLLGKRSFLPAAALLSVAVVVLAGFLIYRVSTGAFPVREVIFYGNKHLSDGELLAMTGMAGNEKLLAVSSKRVSSRLLQSPWIRDVCIRKDFPHRIAIKIHETSPFAILEMKGRAFLVDESGRMLEEMKDVVPFLPVITADPFKNRDIFLEALSLAMVVREKKIATERNRVEIIAEKGSESLSMVMDGVVVKMGQGDYEQKLSRLLALEDEIKKRDILVDYVDLRFANRVVVKPMSGVVK